MSVALGRALACELDTIPVTEKGLWLTYFSLGGNHDFTDVHDYLAGHTAWAEGEHDLLAHAINEELLTLGMPQTAPYTYTDPA
jgi:hypothetical protein